MSGRGFVTGNPDLEPERSVQYNLALRRPGRVRSAVYLYRYEIRDLIERYREGADYYFRNRGRALIRGIELEAQADLGRGFSAELERSGRSCPGENDAAREIVWKRLEVRLPDQSSRGDVSSTMLASVAQVMG